MALVKKLESGGQVDPNLLNIELDKELGQYNLKTKDERKVREALVRLRDFGNTQGNTFTADTLSKKYTVTGQGGDKFIGSPDEVRSS